MRKGLQAAEALRTSRSAAPLELGDFLLLLPSSLGDPRAASVLCAVFDACSEKDGGRDILPVNTAELAVRPALRRAPLQKAG